MAARDRDGSGDGGFYRPFETLSSIIATQGVSPSRRSCPPKEADTKSDRRRLQSPVPSDNSRDQSISVADLAHFREAMEGTLRIDDGSAGGRIASTSRKGEFSVCRGESVASQIEDTFSFREAGESVEGFRNGIDRRALKKMKEGRVPIGPSLDLHGMRVSDLDSRVAAFFGRCQQSGIRYVILIHGRGHHSVDGIPVLRRSLLQSLRFGPLGQDVLAFTRAPATHGGFGALIVLLRRV